MCGASKSGSNVSFRTNFNFGCKVNYVILNCFCLLADRLDFKFVLWLLLCKYGQRKLYSTLAVEIERKGRKRSSWWWWFFKYTKKNFTLTCVSFSPSVYCRCWPWLVVDKKGQSSFFNRTFRCKNKYLLWKASRERYANCLVLTWPKSVGQELYIRVRVIQKP